MKISINSTRLHTIECQAIGEVLKSRIQTGPSKSAYFRRLREAATAAGL